jgi:hypothetical protein
MKVVGGWFCSDRDWVCYLSRRNRILWNDNGHAVVVGPTMNWPESRGPILAVYSIACIESQSDSDQPFNQFSVGRSTAIDKQTLLVPTACFSLR